MIQLKKFTAAKARPLPVVLLTDVSGSMHGKKIEILNRAVAEMIGTFSGEDSERAEINVSVIAFGGSASVHTPLTPADKVAWNPMQASGGTPMGEAFQLLEQMIEDRDIIPSRAYTPTVVLISDGQPTDSWEAALKSLLTAPRASKAMRFAIGIGNDADLFVLSRFIDNPEQAVFSAKDASSLVKFFRFVTMSVTSRKNSVNPNKPAVSLPSGTKKTGIDINTIEDIDFG